MSNVSALANKNGFIKIAALDHRDSLRKMLPEEEIVSFKSLCIDCFSPLVTAVLVDPEYLQVSSKKIKVPVLASLEKSGYKDTPEGRVTELYGDFFNAATAKRIGALACKLLLYFNPDSPVANHQTEIAKEVYLQSRKANLPLLLEIVTYPYKDTVYSESISISKSVKELSPFSDVLKINFCEDLDILSSLACLEKPWVLLSRGMPYAEYKEALTKAKEIGGAKGFAVGRALWQEVKDLKTWKEKEHFIKTTATERLHELSEIFN